MNRSNIKEGFSMGYCVSHCFTLGDIDLLGWGGHGGSMFGRPLVHPYATKKIKEVEVVYVCIYREISYLMMSRLEVLLTQGRTCFVCALDTR